MVVAGRLWKWISSVLMSGWETLLGVSYFDDMPITYDDYVFAAGSGLRRCSKLLPLMNWIASQSKIEVESATIDPCNDETLIQPLPKMI